MNNITLKKGTMLSRSCRQRIDATLRNVPRRPSYLLCIHHYSVSFIQRHLQGAAVLLVCTKSVWFPLVYINLTAKNNTRYTAPNEANSRLYT